MGIKTNKVIADTLESLDGTFTIQTKDIGSGSGSGIDSLNLNGTNLEVNLSDGTTKSVDLAPIDTKDADTIKNKTVDINGISPSETKYMAYVGSNDKIQFIDLPSEKTLIVTLESFGAVGDGVTDDTQAIQNAFDSVDDNVILHGQGKRYRVSSHLNITKNIRFQNAILDASQDTLGSSNTGILEIKKDTLFGAEYTINTDFKKSTKDIELTVTPTDINVNDFIFVYDPNQYFDVANEALIGQIFKVKSVDTANNKIEVVGKSLYTFGGSSAKVKKINTITFNFEEIEIISNNQDMCCGIRTYGAVNSSVKNCFFHNLEFSAIETNYSMNCTFENNLFVDILNTETGYGINLDDATNNILCKNNRGYNVRHLITCGGAYTCNHLIYDGNFAETFDAGLDTHNGSNYVTIINNHVTVMDFYDTTDNNWYIDGDGIIVQGANNVIANNSIFNGRYGVFIQSFAKDKEQKNIIANNIIEDCLDGIYTLSVYGDIIIDSNVISNSVNGYTKYQNEDCGVIGIELGNNNNSLTIDANNVSITCTNNKIKNVYTPIVFYTKRTNQIYKDIVISNNTASNVLNNKKGDEVFLIFEGLNNNTTSKIENIVISNNECSGYYAGIDYDDVTADNILVSGNIFKTSGNNGYAIDIAKSAENIYPLKFKIIGNQLIGDNSASPTAIVLGTTQDTQQYNADGEYIIENNSISGFKQGISIADSYATLQISNNNIKCNSTSNSAIEYITKDANHNNYNVLISNNLIENSTQSLSRGIIISNNITTLMTKNGELNINNNIIKNYDKAIDLDDIFRNISVIGNQVKDGLITMFFDDDVVQNLIVSLNNVYHTNSQSQSPGITVSSTNQNIKSATFIGNNINNFLTGLNIEEIETGYERGTNLYPTGGTRVSATNLGASFKLDT